MGFFSWLKGSKLTEQEEMELSNVKSRIKEPFKKPQQTEVFVDIKAPTVTVFGKTPPSVPARPRGYYYPDADAGGYRVVWLRRDGSTSESFSKDKPGNPDFIPVANEAEASAKASKVPALKPKAATVAVKPVAAAKPVTPQAKAAAIAGHKAARAMGKLHAADSSPEVAQSKLMPEAEESTPEAPQAYYLEPPARLQRSQGARITPKMPRLR